MYRKFKTIIDVIFSIILIILLFPLLIIIFIIACLNTKSFGIYKQERVGYHNKIFSIYKFKTMYDNDNNNDFITEANDTRITKFGKFLRKYKLDELPQLFNILFGDMSFVGPRPDVKGYAELLPLNEQYLLIIKPGITSRAAIYFKKEEFILKNVKDKKYFNDCIIWPIKAKMNNDYALNYKFIEDLSILLSTIFHTESELFQNTYNNK